MKDFVGFELAVGDRVVFIVPNYRYLRSGKIIKMTAKNVRIESGSSTTLRDPKDVIKVLATPKEWQLIKFSAGVE